MQRGVVGAKPEAWTRWVLDLLGAERSDTIDDLFPGSGAVAAAVGVWRTTPRLFAAVGTHQQDRLPLP